MPAEILPTHTPALLREAVRRAAEILRAGQLVAVPTETVYGLAANALDPEAVARIYAAKGRPAHNPVIVHVASLAMARECAAAWPDLAQRLATTFWPGPLTLVVPRSPRIPDLVTAGGNTVGLRWPQHPFMQEVIRACGFPLAAPSANLANRLSPTNAAHVARDFAESLPLIVDGGDCNVGIESTVVDVTGSLPRVLRPGMISEDALFAAAGLPQPGSSTPAASTASPPDSTLRSPGLLTRHYCPRTPLRVDTWRDEEELERRVAALGLVPDDLWIIAHGAVPMSGRFPHVALIPADPEAYARALYAELHRADTAGRKLILVEAIPDDPAWAGIADRLRRAGGVQK